MEACSGSQTHQHGLLGCCPGYSALPEAFAIAGGVGAAFSFDFVTAEAGLSGPAVGPSHSASYE